MSNLEAELRRQKLAGAGLDLDEISFALIEESSQSAGLSKPSFRALLSLFGDDEVLTSKKFHSLTTALWTDPETLTNDQYATLAEKMIVSDFSRIAEMNAYSLCDMVANVFPEHQAREILNCLSRQSALRAAATFSMCELK